MRTSRLLPLLIPLLLLTIFGPSLVSRGPLYGYDTLGEFYPWFEWAFGQIRDGTFPHWNPLFLAGHPFHAAAAVVSLLYPPNYLNLLLPTGTAINWLFFLHFLLAGLSLFAFLRALGRTPAAATFGALAFVLSEAMVSRIPAGEIPEVFVLSWLPLSLLVVERSMSGRCTRQLLWLAPIFALQILGGHLQYLVLCSIALFLYFAAAWVRSVRERGQGSRAYRPLAAFAAALVLGGALAAPQVLPTAELVGLSGRAAGIPPAVAAPAISLPVSELARFLVPDLHGNEHTTGYRGGSVRGQTPLYVGVLALLLALVAAALGGSRGRAFFSLFGAGALLYSMGDRTPLFRLANAVFPGLHFFRIPSRALFLVALSLGVLASGGFDRVLAQANGRGGWRRVARAGAIAILAADLLWHHAPLLHVVSPRRLEPSPEQEAILGLPRPDVAPPRVWTALPNRLSMIEPSFLASYGIEEEISEIEINRGMQIGLAGVTGEIGLIPERYLRFIGPEASYGAYGARDPRILDWLGVRFAELPSGAPPRDPSFVVVPPGPAGGGGRSVYSNQDALPRAFIARRATFLPSEEKVFATIRQRWPDPREEVLLEGAGPVDAAEASGQTAITRYSTLAVSLRANLDSPGYLVLTDPAYPGWEATVDGRPAEILVAHGLFRAVRIEGRGDHAVEFTFRPRLFHAGLGISLAAALFMAGAGLRFGREARKG